MKIVDAIWEKRNLETNTIEITIEEHDTADRVSHILQDQSAGYMVVKLPVSRTDLIFQLQDLGYAYIEDMVTLYHDLHEVSYSPIQKRLRDAVDTATMDKADVDVLCGEIWKGMFDSDRIFLDPYFTWEMAKKRYVNWVQDEYARGTEFVKYLYKDKVIGFFALREAENKEYDSFLGGMYKEYQKGGLGTVVKVPQAVKERGGKKVRASVSTNNIFQLRALTMNGYIPESIIHTFIKHN